MRRYRYAIFVLMYYRIIFPGTILAKIGIETPSPRKRPVFCLVVFQHHIAIIPFVNPNAFGNFDYSKDIAISAFVFENRKGPFLAPDGI